MSVKLSRLISDLCGAEPKVYRVMVVLVGNSSSQDAWGFEIGTGAQLWLLLANKDTIKEIVKSKWNSILNWKKKGCFAVDSCIEKR